MKVLALTAYPERMAATRFRVARYVPYLAARGIEVELVSWLDDRAAASLYLPGARAEVALRSVHGVVRQLSALRGRWDAVWVQREAVLAGPPVVEAVVRALGIPLVLDYDDAVWIAQGSALKQAAKFAWKFDWVLRRASHAIAGSHQLAARARDFGVPVTVLPTTVEHQRWLPLEERSPAADGALLVGWVGTHSTAPQLTLAAPALRRLRAEGHRFRVVVVGAGEGFGLEGLDIETRDWRLERELDDFRTLDIGLTPMFEGPWYEGKCGFKQIQMMAVGVPFVSSLVGGARDFLVNEQNALIARSPDEWYRHLERLLTDAALRSRLGAAGRALVEESLSIERQAGTLADVLRSVRSDASRVG